MFLKTTVQNVDVPKMFRFNIFCKFNQFIKYLILCNLSRIFETFKSKGFSFSGTPTIAFGLS